MKSRVKEVEPFNTILFQLKEAETLNLELTSELKALNKIQKYQDVSYDTMKRDKDYDVDYEKQLDEL